MKIAIVDVLGLTYDGTTLLKRGLGGSESAVILMSKELVKLGFDVTVFNDCTSDDSRPGVYDGVEYRPIKDVESVNQVFDIMIGSRSIASFAPQGLFTELPNFTRLQQASKFKILWMHDTFCQGDELIEDYILEGRINEIFTLSDWHTSYITTCNHGKRRNFEILKNHIFQTRNGIHKWIDWVDVKAKDPDLFVYNASVTKGMIPLVENIWPEILKQIPNAKLVIIGGFYRFRSEHGPDQQEMDWKQMSEKYKDTITFTGVISQQEIATILARASYMVYPCGFPETFGISTLEALAHNVPIITCRYGALEETAIDIASYKIPYPVEPNWAVPWLNKDKQVQIFVKTVVDAYNNKYLHQQKMYACNQVKDICTWDTVALQWKQHFFKVLGQFLPIQEYRKVTKINHEVRKVFGRTFINDVEVQEPRQQQKPIMIITPVYNAEKYIRNCILSVAQQDYDNYTMYIIDDASTDNTLAVIYDTLLELNDISKKVYFEVLENKTNEGAVRNQVCTIASDNYNPSDSIVMLLDGDDWLINDPNIFHKYNNLYKAGAEFTYGSCWSLADNIPLIAQPYPPEVKANKTYRDYKFNWNMPYTHLRTFKKELFDTLDHSVFQDEYGNWLRAGGDTAVFYNVLEQANPDNVICIPDIVYNYNDINPLNDYKINGTEQTRTANKVLSNKSTSKEKFSVVIPTMWRCSEIFYRALQSYIDNDLVDDIIIINNDLLKTPAWDILKHKKVLVFNQATNIKVNPAWNLGVNTAAQDRVAILNDDIIFDPALFEKLQGRINKDSGVHGIIAGEAHFNQPLSTDYSIDFIEWKPGDIIHCFGQAMFIHKSNWIHIPDDLQIYFGDDVIMHYHLHKGLTPVMIYNIQFESPMAATSKDTTITGGYYDRELPVYQAWAVQYPWMYKEQPVIEELVIEQPKQIKKILIAIPTAKYIEVETFKSIYDLEVPEGYEVDFQYFYGYLIDQVRNLIGDWVVNGYDYLFSVDSDISFKPDTLKKLLESDKDVIGGVYRQRLPEQHLEVYDSNYHRMNWDQIVGEVKQIGALGFGCVLIKKQVFLDIGYPWFEYKSALTHDKTLSEDVDFCKKAKSKNHDVWVDPSILCGHHGATTFTVDTTPTVNVSNVQTRLKQLHDTNLFPQEHIDYLKHLSNRISPNIIYDIGACVMHWTNAAKSIWSGATYVLFDAMEEAEFLYGDNLRHMGLLGSENKLVKFYQNLEHPGGNSIFPENTDFSPNARILFPEEKAIWKPMFKLDDVVKAKNLPLPDLIKMDVQGSELNVLLGAQETIKQCNNIILELQRVDYNIGAPKEQEVIQYMKTLGFNSVVKFTGNVQSPDCDYHFSRT
jgi:FkbM family methyltransferase